MVWLLVGLVVVSFGLVVLVGPPYLPTMNRQVETALDMLDLKPGERLLELGCGDGKVLVAGARRGLLVTGIELNPLLAIWCRLRCWRYRSQVTVVWANYWYTGSWPADTKGIFGFVLPKYMSKLDKVISEWHTGPLRLASFAFKIPDKKCTQEKHGVFLYQYR